MSDFRTPDLGNPLQHIETPEPPIPYAKTLADESQAAVIRLVLERNRRERNKRDSKHSEEA